MPWILEIYIGKQCFRKLDLDLSEVILGRSNTCTLHLPAEVVSRRHARMWVSAKLVTLEDLSSTNKVYVNGKAISRCVLNDGDRFTIGPYLCVLRNTPQGGECPKISEGLLLEDPVYETTAHIDVEVVRKIQQKANPLEDTHIEKSSPVRRGSPDLPEESESPDLSRKLGKTK